MSDPDSRTETCTRSLYHPRCHHRQSSPSSLILVAAAVVAIIVGCCFLHHPLCHYHHRRRRRCHDCRCLHRCRRHLHRLRQCTNQTTMCQWDKAIDHMQHCMKWRSHLPWAASPSPRLDATTNDKNKRRWHKQEQAPQNRQQPTMKHFLSDWKEAHVTSYTTVLTLAAIVVIAVAHRCSSHGLLLCCVWSLEVHTGKSVWYFPVLKYVHVAMYRSYVPRYRYQYRDMDRSRFTDASMSVRCLMENAIHSWRRCFPLVSYIICIIYIPQTGQNIDQVI